MDAKNKIFIIEDHFRHGINTYWNQLVTGGGIIKVQGSHLHLGMPTASLDQYTDAQLDDYTMFARSKYPWKPPLKMTVRAKFTFAKSKKNSSQSFHGTAGFGFWNNPFSVTGSIYALPEAIWFFFASSKSAMWLKRHANGFGWKAQIVHSVKWSNFLFFLPTVLAVLHARATKNHQYASYWIERFSGVEEVELSSSLEEWHTYTIEWRKKSARFFVDQQEIMSSKSSPQVPLGFVVWIDNQYAIVSPNGKLKCGTVKSGPWSLSIGSIRIEHLNSSL